MKRKIPVVHLPTSRGDVVGFRRGRKEVILHYRGHENKIQAAVAAQGAYGSWTAYRGDEWHHAEEGRYCKGSAGAYDTAEVDDTTGPCHD